MGFREVCNAGGPIRWVTGRHDLSSKTPSGKLEVSLRETAKYVAGGFRVEMSADRHNRTRAVTNPSRQTGSKLARDSEIYGRWVSERVEMRADRHDRTRAVTTRLAKRHPTNRKSVCGSLRRMSLLGFKEGRNVAGPTRSDTGRHDPSSKTRPDKAEASSLETPKCMGGGFQRG